MQFIKMQGTGNDYVYIDCFSRHIDSAPELAKMVSHRRFGIGSDGLILINPFEGGDAEMVMYNADGSVAEMCGNGLRCVAKYVHDTYHQGKDELTLMTGAGIKTARIIRGEDGRAGSVSLDMGNPIWEPEKIPVKTGQKEIVLDQEIEIAGQKFRYSAVSMGNPHCVIFVEDTEKFPVEKIGSLLETHSMFPNRVNVEFVQLINDHKAIQRTWERGSGETWACGTGAAAVAAVCFRLGHCSSLLNIKLKGGELILEQEASGNMILTGPAVEVFRGEWPDEQKSSIF